MRDKKCQGRGKTPPLRIFAAGGQRRSPLHGILRIATASLRTGFAITPVARKFGTGPVRGVGDAAPYGGFTGGVERVDVGIDPYELLRGI